MTDLDKKRLRWQCRRGMVELELLLYRFLDSHYDSLAEDDRLIFVKLLEEADQTLYQWFLGNEQPVSKDMAAFVKQHFVKESINA